MKTNHTPGPWNIVQGSNSIMSPIGVVATVNMDARGTMGDDARLIAAAPDLLAACVAAAKAIPDGQIAGSPLDCALFQLRAAIAKAEGR